MAYEWVPDPKTNSPSALIETNTFLITDTTLYVDHVEYFPDATSEEPGIAVLGRGEDCETITYTGKTGTSGSGTLTGITREVDKETIGGVEFGTKKQWEIGDDVACVLTAFHLKKLIANATRNTPVTSSSDPTVNDDSGDGYEVGKVWINTSSDVTFVCADNTLGAAVWLRVLDTSDKTGADAGIVSGTAGSAGDIGLWNGDGDLVTLTGVQGNIAYHSGSAWVVLAPGTAGYILKTQGAAANPAWTNNLIHVWLGAEAAYLPATNPAALTEATGATVYAGWSHLDFDDTTAESAVWRVPLPDYNGGNIVLTAYSKPATTPSGAVTLQYDILTIGLANSEAFDEAVVVDTTVNISHSMDTTELQTDVMIASATIDPANVAADDLLVLQLKRDVASDTLSGDGQLLGVLLEYTST